MGKKSKPGRSFFSNLPLDLRSSLRSQTLLPLVPGQNINTLETKQEELDKALGLGAGNDYLPTQPASPSSSDEDEVRPTPVVIPPAPLIMPEVVAESSTSAKKRALLLENDIDVEMSKEKDLSMITITDGEVKKQKVEIKKKGKGKGKAKAIEDGNRFKGHRWDCTGLVTRYTKPTEMPSELVKYWYQRQFLLPEYDRLPLLLDDTGWFSITPQPIAAHIAERCSADVIIDAFCGVGGNTIEFAKTCERVIAIDNNPIRLRLARHNALQMGVADRIEFILGDFVTYAKSLGKRGVGEEIDVVFLSPPWGGTEYMSFTDPTAPTSALYPLSAILPIHGKDLFELCSTLTPNIAYYLPKNVNIDELAQLARPLDQLTEEGGKKRDREWVEVEEEWVGDKLKAVTAYFGGLIAEE